MEKITIVKKFAKKVPRFRLTGNSLIFKIKTVPETENPVLWVKDAITQVVQKVTEEVRPGDKIGFTFSSNNFERGEGWLNFKNAENVKVQDVWSILESIYQSNSTGLDTSTFTITSTVVKMPSGQGNHKKKGYNDFESECAKRRGIVVIKNKDYLCLPRAIVVAIANATKDPEYRNIRQDYKKLQTSRVQQLISDSNVIIPKEGSGIPEIQKFQDFLSNFKITVYDYLGQGRTTIFEGPPAPLKINLLHHKGHFNVITSLTATFACGYYCEECHVPYDHKNRHRCEKKCPACQQNDVCDWKEKQYCYDCNRNFRNKDCFNNHKSNGTCATIRRCNDCLKVLLKDRTHFCNEIFCKICKKQQPLGHLCYMQPDTLEPKTNDYLFIFYDLECRQEKIFDGNSKLHEPNLCVYSQVCSKCINEKNLFFCQNCGFRQKIFKNNVVSELIQDLLLIRNKFKNVVVIAHNGQSYDQQFILHHILTKTDLTPELIMRGTKIISMSIGNLKFIDSLNYFPMSLAKLPKAFGLEEEFKKGYFPHLFNTSENQNYVGPLPDISYYDPDAMKPDERKKFIAWYDENKANIFDMSKEIVEYCISDVKILSEACLKFRNQMLETGNVCPFTEACTIAATCNKVYRRNFLKPDTIGIIPKGGYRCRDNQSKIATQWLIWEELQRKIRINLSAKGTETILGGVKVDGFCSETNQVFEFHGCYFHGCQNCFKHNRNEPLHDNSNETMNSRYETTVSKTERLKTLGYEVVEIWECQFRRNLLENDEIFIYTENHPLMSCVPLNPRDAFFGGRTGNTKLYYNVKEGEKIKYLDVCSLYPWVCKNGKYPVGHPEVLVAPNCPADLTKIEGLIKCKILPPSDLYHPVLPLKGNNKLLFPLCKQCTIEGGDCIHDIEQRALSGTWVIDEVKKALQNGYKILEIYEIWNYEIDQYNKDKRTGGLFTGMMNKFLKIKQQASGWPKSCNSREEKDQYIEEFFNTEGIKLEFSEITENLGLRALAKLMLNSFWGKFGQRENQAKTKIVNDPSEFFKMLCDPSITIKTVLPVNDKTLIVNYEFLDESYDILPTVNVVLAAYTTAQARLKLYSYLEVLGERVLYYDTDSIIFISREGEPEPTIGKCVGDLTCELECYGPGSYITEFVCAGPKSYAYRVFSPTQNKYFETCKVKGISLNFKTSNLINFDKIKDMILNEEPPVYVTYQNFERTPLHEVVTKEKKKIFQINSKKRKFSGYDSVPFGYKKLKE